jgi:hypothetical protein
MSPMLVALWCSCGAKITDASDINDAGQIVLLDHGSDGFDWCPRGVTPELSDVIPFHAEWRRAA